MTTNSSSPRSALALVFAGIALAVTGSVLAFLTDEPSWRYLLTSGVLIQVIGWVRYIRDGRGGAS
ncbi:hypothetical protein [Streptomyces sp. NPDC087538]|uniref:hypothetical protein n=1 Tax=Streptomyces sp. NPDC087538 TaxID=3365797 RepID=UPI00381A9A36